MKIVAIQDFLRVGGTEAQFLDLTARWSERGHEVTRLIFRRGGELLSASQSRGPEPRFLQPINTPWNWWAPALRKVVREIDPDRVICFGRNAHWSFSRAFKSQKFPGLVATIRTGRPLPKGYARIVNAAEAVVANSEFAARLAVDKGAERDRVQVIENGCRMAGTPLPNRERTRMELGLTDEDTVVLCLGSFVAGKAQGRLLSIWEGLASGQRSRLQLWFVGDGPHRKRLEKRVRGLPDGERIRFWGNRKDPERFLVAADGLVSVSREESSPNALVEGLWAGIPIAATECAGVRELVSAEAGGLVSPDSVEGEKKLAEWIGSLPRERDQRRTAAASYQGRARERFDPAARADDYLMLFQEMKSFS